MRLRKLFAAAAFILSGAVPAFAGADDPIFGPGTYDRTLGGLQFYREIVANGGWGKLPSGAAGLKVGSAGPVVAALHRRLAISGDIDAGAASSELFDAGTTAALRRFQRRHGLTETGTVGALTLKALDVPAKTRLMQLAATMERMRNNGFQFPQRYVVVNIPAAVAEAVNGGRVERRHLTVVGRKDRQSPVIETRITAVNVNPTWTAPLSIVKADIMPKVRANPGFLAASNMRVIGGGGEEIPASAVDWTGRTAVNFTIRQDPGATNALGQIRFDMPNAHAVYMHDTPKKELFRSDVRFHSSGCARTADIRNLASWLLADQGVSRRDIDAAVDSTETRTIRLQRPVPVVWTYLTAWGDGVGDVQFREDIYGLDDSAEEIARTTLVARRPAQGTTAGIPAARPPQRTALTANSIDSR
jgi:L,D-transpeptidase YcbB